MVLTHRLSVYLHVCVNVWLQETIGHATAAKYPQYTNGSVPGVVQRKVAGQQSLLPATNIQTVKVVEWLVQNL